MFEKFLSYRGVEDLADWQRKTSTVRSEQQKRANVKIAVIDDQAFSPQQNLRNAGYSIEEIGDIKNISEVEPYQIVLCDLQDVGAHFQSKYQGGFLIDEIKKSYPEKFVIAYTGGSLDLTVVNYASEAADAFVRKDADIYEWRNTLDDLIDSISDPVDVWRRQRDNLVRADVPTQ